MRRLLLLAPLLLTLAACDSYNTGYDDGFNDGQQTRPRVRVVDFEFDRTRYALSNDGTTATFDSRTLTNSTVRQRLAAALATAGDGALVVAYVDSRLLVDATTGGQTWSALPATRAFRDDSGTIPFETVLSYEYSFDNGDFYFDVVSSDPASDFPTGQLFGFAIRRDPRLRVVTVPADIINGTRIDVRDYNAMRAAFDLPE